MWHEFYKADTSIRTTAHGQLMYREFFYTVAWTVNNFTRVKGNRICRHIEWKDPKQPRIAHFIECFKEGTTGYPWIDASMRQMVAEGWVSHIGRFSLATFLTVGQMWCSWEIGQEVRLKF